MQRQLLIEQLATLRLPGMRRALEEQWEQPNAANLDFEQRLALLVDREILCRDNKRITQLLRQATLRQQVRLEDIIYTAERQLQKVQITNLAQGHFIRHHHNVLITGPTGCGKSYLACAIGQQACRLGYKVKYLLLTKFLEELAIAHADGRFPRLMQHLVRMDLLILDDFGLTPITASQRHDLFNLIEDRHQLKSTLVTSQLPVNQWHNYLNEPTLADAILDRLLEHTERIELRGESMRRQKNQLTLASS